MGGAASVMYFASPESFLPLSSSHRLPALCPPWSPPISSCQCSSPSPSVRSLAAWLTASNSLPFRQFVALAEAESGIAPRPPSPPFPDHVGAELVLAPMDQMRQLLKLLFQSRFPVHHVPIIDMPLVFRLEFHYGSLQLAPYTAECFRVDMLNGEVDALELRLPHEWDGRMLHQTVSVQKRVLTFALCLRAHGLSKDLVRVCIDSFFAWRPWSDTTLT